MTNFRSRAIAAISATALALTLAGCSSATKKEFGLEANPPNAFEVGTEAPLSMPPELTQLPPPNPGEPRPQTPDSAQAGANIVSPANALVTAPSQISPGGEALLQQAGPTPPADIRAQVNQNAQLAAKPSGFVQKLMGSAPAPQPVVNAGAEQKRLQENAAMGAPVTKGSTPQESTTPPGLWGRFLNLF